MKSLIYILIFIFIPVFSQAQPPADVRVTPQWVHSTLTATDSQWMVVEVSWGPDGPKNGHLPGAIHINTDEIEYDTFPARRTTAKEKLGRSTSPEQDLAKGISPTDTLPRNFWQLYPDAYLLPALAHMGITRDSRVIVTSHDILAAARLTWTLLYAGVADVRILDGGSQAWTAAGFALSQVNVPRQPQKNFGRTTARHPEYKAGVETVKANLKDRKGRIVDVRTRPEFTGIWAPYSYIPTKGRIPGAVHIGSGDTPWDISQYLAPDKRFIDPKFLSQDWQAKGANDTGAIFYCGTGWRSSATFLLARAAGWKEIRNMDGGWMVWSMDKKAGDNPVE